MLLKNYQELRYKKKQKNIIEKSKRKKLLKSLQKTDKQLILKELQKKLIDKKFKSEIQGRQKFDRKSPD